MLKFGVILLTAIVMVGCTPIDPSRFGIAPTDTATALQLNEIARTPDTLEAFFGGATSKVYNPETGTQIEYLAADGTAYVANAANGSVIVGDWLASESPFAGGPADICLRYDATVYEFTGELGDGLQCRPGRFFAYIKDEVVDGDPLGLASTGSGLPAILAAGNDVSISEAFRALDKGQFRGENRVTWNWRLQETAGEGGGPPS